MYSFQEKLKLSQNDEPALVCSKNRETTSTGSITFSSDYKPFGEEYNPSGSNSFFFMYTGKYYDSLTGLYYYNARFYDPAIQRFISEDSYTGQSNQPQSLNRYSYVEDNPERFTDPSGNYIDFYDYVAYIWFPTHYIEFAGDIGIIIGVSLGIWFLNAWVIAASFTFWGVANLINGWLYGDWLEQIDAMVAFSMEVLYTILLYASWWLRISILAAIGLNAWAWISPALLFEAAHMVAAVAAASWIVGSTLTEIEQEWYLYNGWYFWW